MKQEVDGLSAFARKAGQIRRNQPVFGSVAPILSVKRFILRIAERKLSLGKKLLDLGHSDGETNRLIESLVVTGLELAMRRRRNCKLWNLTIDEFAGYVPDGVPDGS